MADKKRILVVDDSPIEIRVLIEILKDQYTVVAATSGDMALEIMHEQKPDLVLMDISMSPLDGYQTCKIIKQTLDDIPVIFVSSNSDTGAILKGFEAGGHDYIAKPIELNILKEKVRVTLEQLEKRNQLVHEKDEVSELVMAAITNVSDLGIVLNFLRYGTRKRTAQELAELMLASCKEYELNASVLVLGHDQEPNIASCEVDILPLEKEVLIRALSFNERLMENGNRLIIHFDTVSLLIKNLPESESRRGELRDYLVILCENAHELNWKIVRDMHIGQQRAEMLLSIVDESKGVLHDIAAFQHHYKARCLGMLDELIQEIHTQMPALNMTSEQEDRIRDIIHSKLTGSIERFDKEFEVDKKMKNHIERLDSLTTQITNLNP
jgi:CheY-like chemotaxis protein